MSLSKQRYLNHVAGWHDRRCALSLPSTNLVSDNGNVVRGWLILILAAWAKAREVWHLYRARRGLSNIIITSKSKFLSFASYIGPVQLAKWSRCDKAYGKGHRQRRVKEREWDLKELHYEKFHTVNRSLTDAKVINSMGLRWAHHVTGIFQNFNAWT